MAQFGSALDWGSSGRRFKSCQPDSECASQSGFGEIRSCLFVLNNAPYANPPADPIASLGLQRVRRSGCRRWRTECSATKAAVRHGRRRIVIASLLLSLGVSDVTSHGRRISSFHIETGPRSRILQCDPDTETKCRDQRARRRSLWLSNSSSVRSPESRVGYREWWRDPTLTAPAASRSTVNTNLTSADRPGRCLVKLGAIGGATDA